MGTETTDNPPPAAGPALEYAPPPRLARRRWAKRAGWLLLAAAILVPTYTLLAPRIERRWEFIDAQRLWLEMSRPADQFGYLNRWQTQPGGSSYMNAASGESIHYALRQSYRLPTHANVATLFLHRRRAPGGRERLVVVEIGSPLPVNQHNPPAKASNRLVIGWHTGRTAGWLWAPSDLKSGTLAVDRLPIPPTGEIAFHNGQPNPNDLAHFTIAFSMDSTPGVLDGRLLPDGTVAFTVTSGPLTVISNTPGQAP